MSAAPKRLPSKFHYDDVGSALFDAITRLPEYYLTRAETEILSEWGWQIVRLLDAPLDFLELGSGSAVKTRLLIGEALRVQDELRYSPIDISTEAICSSSLALVESFPGLHVRAYAGDYFDVLESQAVLSDRKMLAMLMGSNIGNYEPDEARLLFSLLGSALRPGDGLLIGTDLRKDRATLEMAYDDPHRRNCRLSTATCSRGSIASSTQTSTSGNSGTSCTTTSGAVRSTRFWKRRSACAVRISARRSSHYRRSRRTNPHGIVVQVYR